MKYKSLKDSEIILIAQHNNNVFSMLIKKWEKMCIKGIFITGKKAKLQTRFQFQIFYTDICTWQPWNVSPGVKFFFSVNKLRI